MTEMKSGFERKISVQLKQSGMGFTYETLKLPYVLNGTYSPDFILDNGIIIETKGYMDRDAKRKMEAVKRQYPDLDLRILFMDASKKMPNSKQTHGAWASKMGYVWAEGEVPREWLKQTNT